MKCLLDQAVQHTGNAQDAYPALRLRYLHLAHSCRHVLARQQSLFYLRPVRLQPRLQLQDRESIDSRRSFVFHHPLVGAQHVAAFQRSFQQPAALPVSFPHQSPCAPPRPTQFPADSAAFASVLALLAYASASSARIEVCCPTPVFHVWAFAPIARNYDALGSLLAIPPLASRRRVALGQTARSPRVLRTHLLAYLCRIYVATFRASTGLRIYWPAHPAAPPLSGKL